MAKPVKPAAWQEAQEPQALSLPAFRQWQRRIARHRQHLIAAREVTDIAQYEKEVQELERASAAHKSSRKAQKREEEAKLRRDNVRLVQKLCDVARQSEKRQEAITALGTDAKANVLKSKPHRWKRQQAILADNLVLLQRLESVRSVVPSASQAVESHSRHRAIAARISRARRPVMARPVGPPPRRKGPRVDKSRMSVLAEEVEVTFSELPEARRAPLHLAEAEAVVLLPALEDREDLSVLLPITYDECGMGLPEADVRKADPDTRQDANPEDASDAGSDFSEDFEEPSDTESDR